MQINWAHMSILYAVSCLLGALALEHFGRLHNAAWRPTALVRAFVIPPVRAISAAIGRLLAEIVSIPVQFFNLFEGFGVTLYEIGLTAYDLLWAGCAFGVQLFHQLWLKFKDSAARYLIAIAVCTVCLGAAYWFLLGYLHMERKNRILGTVMAPPVTMLCIYVIYSNAVEAYLLRKSDDRKNTLRDVSEREIAAVVRGEVRREVVEGEGEHQEPVRRGRRRR